MKEELWASDELKREETRGVFVIGLIATLIGIRPIILNEEYYSVPLIYCTNVLIFFWGVYLFLIVISLSDDIKLPSRENEELWMSKENFLKIKIFARCMFIFGIFLVAIYIGLLVDVFLLFVALPITLFVILPFIILPFLIFRRVFRYFKVLREKLKI